MEIGKIIRGIRKERGSTLEQVAFDADSDASNLSRIERCLQRPSDEVLERIAHALGTTASAIYSLAANISSEEVGERALLANDYAEDAVELRRHFRMLTPENRRLAVEHVKLLYRLQDKNSR